jgi:hypothetical protein
MSTNFLDDCQKLDEFADSVGKHPRTVKRWMDEPNGLPHLRLGKTPFIHVPTAREWLLGRIHKPNRRRV